MYGERRRGRYCHLQYEKRGDPATEGVPTFSKGSPFLPDARWCGYSLAGQTLFPVGGVEGLVSLGHIQWHLQECSQIQ